MRFSIRLTFLSMALILCYCSTQNKPVHPELEYIESELASRRNLLSKDSLFSNSVNDIQKSVKDLCLLSIDVENLNACIQKSNSYFTNTSVSYGLDTSGFYNLYKGLPLSEFEVTIKKNELCLLNKLIISRNINGGLMFTAQ